MTRLGFRGKLCCDCRVPRVQSVAVLTMHAVAAVDTVVVLAVDAANLP